MLRLEDQNGTAVQHRTAGYTPRRSWQTWLFGRPLQTADAPEQAINKIVGLAVFSSDNMSSIAYAPQELLFVLAAAGAGALHLAFPIALAIVGLLAILVISYEQTIHAYPSGGGAYIVARDNLGELPAQVAGAALLTDYILTVAVSISSGVAQIASAFPVLFPWRVEIAIGFILFVMVINLRGVKEAGAVFAVPTYFFIFVMFGTVIIALFRYVTGSLGTVIDPPEMEMLHGAQAVSLFLILRAFANGTSALTGVEAVSNGITAFREPRSRNAGITLIWMALILGSLMLSITFLATHIGAVPSETETVVSQLARTVYGNEGLLYLGVISATTLILVMAANTAFAGFPRLSALLAIDGFLPRQLAYRGSRLVYSRGIGVLALTASLLIVIFDASVTSLIPLYAIGVFLSFTLSQGGMARRWWKIGHLAPGVEVKERGSTLRFERNWQLKMVINAIGAMLTAVVALIFAVTKFTDGAYIVLILIPVIVFILSAIHRHYRSLAKSLSLEDYSEPPQVPRHRVILPVSGVHRGTLAALRYAQKLSDDITAVHVMIEPEDAERVRKRWETWGEGVRLVILDSPYRLLVEPMLEYIEEIAAERQPNETITVVVPRFVPKHWTANALHTQAATWLQLALLGKPGIVITDVPYQVE
jgi:amino acid transporter